VDNSDLKTFGQVNDGFKKARLDGHGRRIVRVVQNQQFWTRQQSLADHSDGIEKLLVVAERHCDYITAGQSDRINMNRKGRISYDSRIARAKHRQAQMTEPFFGADAGQHFRFRIERNVPLSFVFESHFPAEVENAFGSTIAVVSRIPCSFAEFFNHQVRSPVHRVAHP